MAQATYDNFRSGLRTQGAPIFETSLSQTLTADNQLVNTRGVTTVYLSSDNTTATDRTFTLTNGDDAGHRILIIFYSAGATTADLQDTGNVKLSAAWQPQQYDTLSLYYTGTEWVETGRTDN